MGKLVVQLKKYRLQIATVIALTIFQVFSELLLPTLMAEIVDRGITNSDTAYIIKIGILMLAVTLAGTVAAAVAGYKASMVGMGCSRDMRRELFQKVQALSPGEFDQIGTSSLITRTTNDISQIQTIVIMGLRMAVRAPLMAAGGIVMAVYKNPGLSSVLLAAIVVIALLIAAVSSVSMPLFRRMQERMDNLNRVVRESLTGVRVIRAFDRMDYEIERFGKANGDLMDVSLKVQRIISAMMPLLMFTINITIIGLIWIGSSKIDRGSLKIGDLMAFIQYAIQILNSVIMLSIIFISIPRAAVSMNRISEVMQTKSMIKDPAEPVAAEKTGTLEFRNVCFWHEGAKEAAIDGISFKAAAGEVTAIIGSTGSGKSTLVSMIPRFYDPCEGSVLVDGVDVRNMKQSELRERIGLATQKPVLFSGTVRENIRFGNDGISEERVKKAAQLSHCEEFILAMEDGYEALVSQGGSNLSGGQKQRISIARAVADKKEIYIFDDSFSALDFKTDAAVRAALRDETSGSTVIIVSQRVSTIMDADRIIVLENGRMAGMGTHDELMDKSDVYRDIVLSQMPKEVI